MAKQAITQKETQVSTGNGIGKQIEQTLTVDDTSLPSPQELAAYKEINPKIVEYLLSASEQEQKHRHEMDLQKVEIIKETNQMQGRVNRLGMFLAFLIVVFFLSVSALALYWDKPWFAGMMGVGSILSIVSIFIPKNTQDTNRKQKRR